MIKDDNDSSGILVNRKYLFDTGYFLLRNLIEVGVELSDIENLFFTHLHHDHYMALPQILFWYLQKNKPLEKLHIWGPKADVRRVVTLAMNFLQAGTDQPFFHNAGFPTIHEVVPGDYITIDGMTFEAGKAYHPIDCLCWRITEQATGKVLGISGDTFWLDSLPKSLHDCDMLIHETALGDSKVDYAKPLGCLHSGIEVSLRTADGSHSKQLFIIHLNKERGAKTIAKAATLSDRTVIYPERFLPYEL